MVQNLITKSKNVVCCVRVSDLHINCLYLFKSVNLESKYSYSLIHYEAHSYIKRYDITSCDTPNIFSFPKAYSPSAMRPTVTKYVRVTPLSFDVKDATSATKPNVSSMITFVLLLLILKVLYPVWPKHL